MASRTIHFFNLPTPATFRSVAAASFAPLFLVCAAAARAHECAISPAQVKLGETVRITCPAKFTSAKFGERTIKLFPQPDGSTFGLLPISVKDSTGPSSVTLARDSAEPGDTVKLVVRKTTFPSQNVTLTPEIEGLRSTPDEIKILTNFKEALSDARFWRDPLAPPVTGCMTSPFGVKRLHNGKPTGEYHGGVDQRTPAGEPIRAVAAGTVTFAQAFNVLGNAVGIDHGQGLESMYLHMSKLEVTAGAKVERGDVLGYAGSTGRSTGPHLHWVLYVNGINVNPAQWMKLQPCPRGKSR